MSAATGPTLLPQSFLARLSGTPRPVAVKLGAVTAYRYAGLTATGPAQRLTAYVVPTDAGIATIACVGAAAAASPDCERIATSLDADPTSASHLIGTPAYLAPERLDGAPASPRSDLYSLGVVLYEALAGAKPFAGDVPLAVAQSIQEGTHRPLAEVRPEVDAGLAGVVERAMSRDPDARFPSAAAMAAALAVRTDGDDTRVLPVAPVRERRPRWVVLAAVAAIVGAIVLAALIAYDRTRAPARIEPPVATTVVTSPPTSPPVTTPVTTAPRRGAHDKPGKGRGGEGND